MPKLPISGSFSEKMYREEHNSAYYIVKGNQIVQHTHYSMPLSDQKVLASLIRSIKPNQNNLTVRFNTKQYMEMLGMKRSGTTFDTIMHTLYHIANDNFFIRLPDGRYKMWFWLDKIIADPHGKGNFLVRFRPELKQYLFNQSKNYRTIYRFSDIMLMRSRFSPRLFEIFRSNQSRQKIQKRGLNYSINELKYSLNLVHRDKRTGKIMHDKNGNIKFMYSPFSNFNNRVLKPARREINELTEYNVRMIRLRKSRKVIGINVTMLKKNKKQKARRDDLIYCITHHIPKSEWKNWREDKISGKFHKVHPHKKNRNQTVDGTFHIVRSKKNNKLSNYLLRHPVPMKIVNMGGDKVCYYSPLVHKYIWTTRKNYEKQVRLYDEQKRLIKQLKKHK